MRNRVVVIHNPTLKSIHFTSTKLQGNDVWFPFEGKQENLHQEVEKIMILNNVAHNVADVQLIRHCGICDEFEVKYNEPD